MKVEKMKIQHIDPRDIEIPKVRIDSAFDQDILEMFADDIKKTGIEQALIVGRSGDHLWVIDGLHRLQQALLNGFPTVPCIVRDMDLKQIQIRNLVSNRLRGKTKTSEEIKVVGDLYTNHGATIDEIVEKTGMRRDRLETMILITQAHPEILRALDDEQISFAAAGELIRFKDPRHQHAMVMSCIQYRPKAADLRTWVTDAIKLIDEQKTATIAAGPPPTPAVPTAPCACCQGNFPLQQLSGVPLCRSCHSLLIQAYDEVKKLEAAQAKAAAAAVQLAPQPSGSGAGSP
jgi:ParB/RepB/Spo0J family partition protein